MRFCKAKIESERHNQPQTSFWHALLAADMQRSSSNNEAQNLECS
jgi:hypothetical protein